MKAAGASTTVVNRWIASRRLPPEVGSHADAASSGHPHWWPAYEKINGRLESGSGSPAATHIRDGTIESPRGYDFFSKHSVLCCSCSHARPSETRTVCSRTTRMHPCRAYSTGSRPRHRCA